MTLPNDSLHGYVRFYLQQLAALDEVHAALSRARTDVTEAIAPYADVLSAGYEDAVSYGSRAAEATAKLTTARLWRPDDPATLTGLTDVYEVPGRFTFQGDDGTDAGDDGNLAALRALVRETRADIEAQRGWITGLARVPTGATRLAEGLSVQELAEQDRERRRRLEPFEPVAAALREQCTKVLDVVRGVPRPDVAALETANPNYQEYVRRVQALYTKALPYLRRSLADLCAAAQVDTPASWPDALPFSDALPEDLLAAPAAETPAVSALRAQLEQAEGQVQAIVRAIEEASLTQRKREQDKLAALSRDEELKTELEAAKNIVRWASRGEERDQLAATLAASAQQRDARATLVAQLTQQQQQFDALAQQYRADVSAKEQAAQATQSKLAETRDNPPALFGKDEWRRKVEELEGDLKEAREFVATSRARLAQAEEQLAAVSTRLAGEKTQVAMLDRAVADAQARTDAVQRDVLEIEKSLGAHRPAHRVTLAQADEYLLGVSNMRNEVRARIDTLTRQHSAGQLERERIEAQGRVWTAERERLRGALDQARKAGATAQQEAARQLSARRQQGVAQYIERTLAPLEESLSQVDRVFIDPARQVLIQRAGGPPPKAGTIRAQAEALSLALAQLAPRVDPLLTEQSGRLDAIERGFLAEVDAAVQRAWG
jgi:hypothetical protein